MKKIFSLNLFSFIIFIQILFLFLGMMTGKVSLMEMGEEWGKYFFTLAGFPKESVFIMLLSYSFWMSPPIQALLFKLSEKIVTRQQAVFITTLFSCLLCPLDSAFGLLGGTALSLMLAKKFLLPLSYLVAGSISGILMSKLGLAGILYIQTVVSLQPDTDITQMVMSLTMPGVPANGSPHPLANIDLALKIVFNSTNTLLHFIFIISLPFINYFYYYLRNSGDKSNPSPSHSEITPPKKHFNHSNPVIHYFLKSAFILPPLLYLSALFINDIFINKQTVVLLSLMSVLFLWTDLDYCINSFKEGLGVLGRWFVFLPLYAGMGGIISKSGMMEKFFSFIQMLSGPITSPSLIFISAGVTDILLPFHPKKWAGLWSSITAMQNNFQIPLEKLVSAGLWGEALSGLINPFWILPAISMAGLPFRKIISQTATTFLFAGFLLSTFILIVF